MATVTTTDAPAYTALGRRLGCLLEFRDNPDKYLDPAYSLSM